ncbi:ABC-type Fe3+-hydroxamate transport system, periplasmic component [Desulfitobacterium dichloroeliminans LMG P-21439]|uniref:ABC-type Fe3+-hydroxamate transport system, periplasmic component n=1 Tax=Desulfitobacterium dichloroeliminans (strain LMG P-21439 / DCA1) TaxID=871963 RepID=L0FAK2_DESDL|nr:ABC transporter substrate-binding protein [Desulfitobacterium dichloroeliminans]AGA69686.1 ABC-type Fe3+-hydroxamate transport system, periplasmic component [Desulfitobacterium dichloroeliminans LMG P-21439]
MHKKALSLFTLIALSISFLLISGCQSISNTSQPPKSTAEQETAQQTSYPLTYTDDSRVESTLTTEPQRIVCLAPASTEILYALGLESKLVAVTIYDNYPVGIQDKVEFVFEDSLNPNMEQILQLNPDLVVMGMHDEKLVSAIRSLKLPVVQLNPQSIAVTYQAIEKLGYLTNTQEQAQELVQVMKEKELTIADKISSLKDSERVNVWIEVDPGLFTAGEGTFLNELIVKAGGINIAHDVKDWAQYSEEQIIAKNPQVILETYSYYMENVKDTILARPAWQSLDAIKNARVYTLDSDMVTRPGPRIIDGLASIAQTLYPELF